MPNGRESICPLTESSSGAVSDQHSGLTGTERAEDDVSLPLLHAATQDCSTGKLAFVQMPRNPLKLPRGVDIDNSLQHSDGVVQVAQNVKFAFLRRITDDKVFHVLHFAIRQSLTI